MLRYENQSVNAYKGNSLCLFWQTNEAHKYTPWLEWEIMEKLYSRLRNGVHIITKIL
jgi:DUF2075 family protein